jgi:hypothetical protein
METYKKVIWGCVILAVVLVGALIVYFFFIKTDVPDTPPPALVSNTEENIAAPVSEVKKETGKKDNTDPLFLDIKLNASDGTLRELLKECSPRREFANWLINDEIIRKFVAVVDNIAGGISPASHLEFLAPSGAFKTITKGYNIYIDPNSYKRYNSIARVIESLDAKQLVKIYKEIKPLVNEAYKELGYPDKNFQDTLFQAFSVLLNTPVPKDDVLLVEKVTSFAFSDPGLENLSAAQKHLIRMGRVNAGKIQAKIKEILEEIRREET